MNRELACGLGRRNHGCERKKNRRQQSRRDGVRMGTGFHGFKSDKYNFPRGTSNAELGRLGIMPFGISGRGRPEGTFDNSPTFQGWDQRNTGTSPGGTVEADAGRRIAAVPPGLDSSVTLPTVETVGYCHQSLRDNSQPEIPKGLRVTPGYPC